MALKGVAVSKNEIEFNKKKWFVSPTKNFFDLVFSLPKNNSKNQAKQSLDQKKYYTCPGHGSTVLMYFWLYLTPSHIIF